MKEHSIIFSAPMVRAILAETKSQTRRLVKPQPTGDPRPLSEWSMGLAAACHDHAPDPVKLAAHSERLKGRIFPFTSNGGSLMSPTCPYGQPGDRLWVRETFLLRGAAGTHCVYRADAQDEGEAAGFAAMYGGWKPSIFMRRKLSRITLAVTDVRVERLQDISASDVLAEGITDRWSRGNVAWSAECCDEARADYRELWDSINAKRAPWSSNPLVWVVEFKRIVL